MRNNTIHNTTIWFDLQILMSAIPTPARMAQAVWMLWTATAVRVLQASRELTATLVRIVALD